MAEVPTVKVPIEFVTKDSGVREQFDSGMQRDTQDNKLRYELALDGHVVEELFGINSIIDKLIGWMRGFVDPVEFLREVCEAEGGVFEMLDRYAGLMTRGAVKYDARNWMKASGRAEFDRFVSSAARHTAQYVRGDRDEDHAAAIIFNVNGAEYVRARMAVDETQMTEYIKSKMATVKLGFEASSPKGPDA